PYFCARLLIPPAPPFPHQAHWWRAQATRFMLRWPSAYLCHIINRERHHVYGMHMARQVVASQEDQRTLLAQFGTSGRGPEDQRSLAAEFGRSGRGPEGGKREVGKRSTAAEPTEGRPELGRDGRVSDEQQGGAEWGGEEVVRRRLKESEKESEVEQGKEVGRWWEFEQQ
ncbi:unnamed protein product, partial [Closterium sp. NIES-54]